MSSGAGNQGERAPPQTQDPQAQTHQDHYDSSTQRYVTQANSSQQLSGQPSGVMYPGPHPLDMQGPSPIPMQNARMAQIYAQEFMWPQTVWQERDGKLIHWQQTHDPQYQQSAQRQQYGQQTYWHQSPDAQYQQSAQQQQYGQQTYWQQYPDPQYQQSAYEEQTGGFNPSTAPATAGPSKRDHKGKGRS